MDRVHAPDSVGTLGAKLAEVNKWKKKQLKHLSELKIVIPKELQEVYEEVNSL